MKKIIHLLLCTMLCFSLFACGDSTKSAKDTVSSMLTDYQNQKWENLGNYFENGDVNESLDEFDTKDMTSYEKELMEVLLDKITDIEFNIDDSNEEGNEANVKVTIKAMNVGTKLLEGVQDLFLLAFSSADLSEEELEKKSSEALIEPLKECERTFETTIDLKLKKIDDEWKISSNPMDLLDAMMGGLYSMANQLDFEI